MLGHRFRPDALVTVVGGDAGRTRENIDGLLRRELLTVNEEISSPGHGELVFVQDLVREVAYHTLARTERRALHLAAARYLETLDEDVAEQLAGHLVEAHRLTRAAARGGSARATRGRCAPLCGTGRNGGPRAGARARISAGRARARSRRAASDTPRGGC